MKREIDVIPILVFSVLSLIVVLPLLFPPGYILTLDQVMAGEIALPSFTSSPFLFVTFIWLVNQIIPSYWIQKIILFTVFFLSGWGMYRLTPVKSSWARIFAGIFYTVNPFVYERILAGQWSLLLGYSLFPFFVSFLLDFFDNPGKNSAIKLAVSSTIITSCVIHFSLILASFFLIYGIIFILFHQDKISSLWKYFWVLGGLVFILNINWLLPTIFRRSELNEAISQFAHEDLIAFQSVEDKQFGLIFNLLSGYGFWPEVHRYFIIPKDIVFIWPVISLVFIGLSIWGFIKLFQEKEKVNSPLLITLVIMFLISLDLAGGIALQSFSTTVFSLYDNFPPLRGFREPQKLIGIIMFCYAFLGSGGLDYFLDKFRKKFLFLISYFLFLMLPFIYTPTVFGGFWGQLKPVFYPQSWFEVNKILNNDKDDFLTLSFPWHQYLRFNFANNRVIANPAPYFFDKPILSSQNYETIPLYTHETRPEALHVEGLLNIEKEGVNLLGEKVEERLPWGQSLSPINVKYIILAKDDDWESYRFLDNQPDLKKIYEGSEMILYQNLSWGIEIEFWPY